MSDSNMFSFGSAPTPTLSCSTDAIATRIEARIEALSADVNKLNALIEINTSIAASNTDKINTILDKMESLSIKVIYVINKNTDWGE